MKVDRFKLEEERFTGKSYYVYMTVGKWDEEMQLVTDDWVLTDVYDREFNEFNEAFEYAQLTLITPMAEQLLSRAMSEDANVDALQFTIDEDEWDDGDAFRTRIVGIQAMKSHSRFVTTTYSWAYFGVMMPLGQEG